MSTIHKRMPVILHLDDFERWLDPEIQRVVELEDLFSPYPDGGMEAYPVSREVGNSRIDHPGLVARV